MQIDNADRSDFRQILHQILQEQDGPRVQRHKADERDGHAHHQISIGVT